jgi:hypothetical protein
MRWVVPVKWKKGLSAFARGISFAGERDPKAAVNRHRGYGKGGKMGFFGKYFFGFGRKKSDDKQQSGDMRKATGAGPAIAAHSKDARSSAATGQNPAAAKKKSNN